MCWSLFVFSISPTTMHFCFCLPNLTTVHLYFSCSLIIPHHYKSPSHEKPLLNLHLPLSTPHHHTLSLPGVNSIFPSPLRILPPRDKLYLSLTTMNSPSQGWTLSIPHHYKFSLPGINSIYPSPLRILPPRDNLYLSLIITNSGVLLWQYCRVDSHI